MSADQPCPICERADGVRRHCIGLLCGWLECRRCKAIWVADDPSRISVEKQEKRPD